MQGATDFMLVMKKKKRTDETATLYITGRDVYQQELCIQFDKQQCRWINLGTVEEIEEKKVALSYTSDPLVQSICYLVSATPYMWEGSILDLHNEVTRYTGAVLTETGNALAARVRNMAAMLEYRDSIEYRYSPKNVKKNGKVMRLHSFQKKTATTATTILLLLIATTATLFLG